MPMTSQEMIKFLKENGYHAKDLKKGLEQGILKQAGLK